MAWQNRNVLLLMDLRAAHNKGLMLKRVLLVPTDKYSSYMQPMNQGIIYYMQ
jgi:hypothetical protein